MNRERQAGNRTRSAMLNPIVLALLVMTAGVVLGQANVEGVDAPDVTIVLENVKSEAWVVTAVEVAEVEADSVEADTAVGDTAEGNTEGADTVEGAGAESAAAESGEVAEMGVENPVIRLEVGNRYRFVNLGTLTIHPFAIRGIDGEPILGQRPKDRPFEVDPAVAFVADDQGITFTLTEALAEVVSTYYCTAHPTPLMESGIEIVSYSE